MTRPTVTLGNVDVTAYIQDRSLSVKFKDADVVLIDCPSPLPAVGQGAVITNPTWTGFITGRTQVLYHKKDGTAGHFTTFRLQNNNVLADLGAGPFNLTDGPPANYRDLTVEELNTDGKLEIRAKATTYTAGLKAGHGVTLTSAINGYSGETFTVMDVTTTWPTADGPNYTIDLGHGDFAAASTGGSGPGGSDVPLTPHTLGDEIDRRCCSSSGSSDPYIPTDEYPSCGVDSWPYEGTATGVSDGVSGLPGTANRMAVALDGWPCFSEGVTYNYDISGTSADSGAYDWSLGLAGGVGGNASPPSVWNPSHPVSPDAASFHITGTFVCLNPGVVPVPFTVWFYANHADSIHAHRAISVSYRFWPAGTPTTSTPNAGQQAHEESTPAGTSVQTAYPYQPGTANVTVGGVRVTPDETDPSTGTLTLPGDPAGGKVIVHYIVASTTATGGGGTYPVSSVDYPPYTVLGSGGAGLGSKVLHDNGTWTPVSADTPVILLADGASTPFSFNDLLQRDDGAGFMYSDPD